MPKSKDNANYSYFRQKEFSRLLNRNISTEMHEDQTACHLIYRSWFVDEVKNEGTFEEIEKSRLAIMNFNSKTIVFMRAPTVQRTSQRLQLFVIPADRELIIFFATQPRPISKQEPDLAEPFSSTHLQ